MSRTCDLVNHRVTEAGKKPTDSFPREEGRTPRRLHKEHGEDDRKRRHLTLFARHGLPNPKATQLVRDLTMKAFTSHKR
jgi:hypothetical protein